MIPDSESIERAALEDLHAAATPSQIDDLGLRGQTIGSAFVSVAGSLPASAIVVNRAIGVGLGAPETRDTTEAIVAAYRNNGVGRFYVQVHPEARPPEVGGWLERAGVVKARGWQKFSRGREPVEDRPTDLEVREIGPRDGEAFGRIVCAAFDLGEAAAPWLARLPGRDGWRIFMTFDGKEPAGTGAMFVRDGLAWMDWAATDPAFRRRGSQGAVVSARLRLALELGCRAIFTCTGVAVEGDPQHSYRNILKAGFRTEYVRENYAPSQR